MTSQPDLFAQDERDEAEQSHADSWRICWGWPGPEVGGLCSVNGTVADTEDGNRIYAYMETCRLIERRGDGRWLAVIEMGEVHGKPWRKDGTRLLLGSWISGHRSIS